MNSALAAFFLSAGVVALAEMGDKTQLLAMACAAKYKVLKVILGVFLATLLNQLLAVAVGNLITRFTAVQTWIQAIAALSFIFFGLWTLREEKQDDGGEYCKTRYGAVMTVAATFFIAELGDKTQLATIALAARFPEAPAVILAGTTAGMLMANSVGICAGAAISRKIPRKSVKLVSAGAFILFGFIGTYQVATENLDLSLPTAFLILAGLAAATGASVYMLTRKNKVFCR